MSIDIKNTNINKKPLYMAKKEIEEFKNEAKNFPYWIIKTSKWYDPEGLNIKDNNFNIQFAGNYNECRNKLKKIISDAKINNNIIELTELNFVTIYYPNAISKATFTIVKNYF